MGLDDLSLTIGKLKEAVDEGNRQRSAQFKLIAETNASVSKLTAEFQAHAAVGAGSQEKIEGHAEKLDVHHERIGALETKSHLHDRILAGIGAVTLALISALAINVFGWIPHKP